MSDGPTVQDFASAPVPPEELDALAPPLASAAADAHFERPAAAAPGPRLLSEEAAAAAAGPLLLPEEAAAAAAGPLLFSEEAAAAASPPHCLPQKVVHVACLTPLIPTCTHQESPIRFKPV